MTITFQDDFITKLLEFEPFLSGEAKKSLAALGGLMQCFPSQKMPEIEKTVRSLLAILNCFSGQSAGEAEKSIKSLLLNSVTTVPAMLNRTRALVGGTAGESTAHFLKDVKKLSAGDLLALGKALGFNLTGAKAKVCEELRRWIESGGQVVPVSPKQQAVDEGRRLAAPVKSLMNHINPENADRILQTVESAYTNLKAEGFQAFAQELGITVNGSKTVMRKQVKDFVSGLAVSHVQTRF